MHVIKKFLLYNTEKSPLQITFVYSPPRIQAGDLRRWVEDIEVKWSKKFAGVESMKKGFHTRIPWVYPQVLGEKVRTSLTWSEGNHVYLRVYSTQSQTCEENLWKIRDLKAQVNYNLKVCLPKCVKELFWVNQEHVCLDNS